MTDYALKLSIKITTIRTSTKCNEKQVQTGAWYRYSYGYGYGYRYKLAPPAWPVAGNLAAFFRHMQRGGTGRERE